MAEKRKADYVMLLKSSSKRKFNKVEIFCAEQWGGNPKMFRLRVNGRWHDVKNPEAPKYYYKTHIRDLVWQAVHF